MSAADDLKLVRYTDVRHSIDRRPPFFSHACAMADRLTEPADLARSPFYRYRFTLVP